MPGKAVKVCVCGGVDRVEMGVGKAMSHATEILTFEVFKQSLTLERPKDVRLPLCYFYFYLSK